MRKSRLVYSTDQTVSTNMEKAVASTFTDGTVRIRRETKSRGGKAVSVIDGLPADAASLKSLCTKLKQQCGCGGSVKNGAIEIQGDHREKLASTLRNDGYQVKLAGG